MGHSLGAAVAHELAQEHGLRYELYANPGFNSGETDKHRHAHYGDPISMFDNAQRKRASSLNVHTYRNVAKRVDLSPARERWA